MIKITKNYPFLRFLGLKLSQFSEKHHSPKKEHYSLNEPSERTFRDNSAFIQVDIDGLKLKEEITTVEIDLESFLSQINFTLLEITEMLEDNLQNKINPFEINKFLLKLTNLFEQTNDFGFFFKDKKSSENFVKFLKKYGRVLSSEEFLLTNMSKFTLFFMYRWLLTNPVKSSPIKHGFLEIFKIHSDENHLFDYYPLCLMYLKFSGDKNAEEFLSEVLVNIKLKQVLKRKIDNVVEESRFRENLSFPNITCSNMKFLPNINSPDKLLFLSNFTTLEINHETFSVQIQELSITFDKDANWNQVFDSINLLFFYFSFLEIGKFSEIVNKLPFEIKTVYNLVEISSRAVNSALIYLSREIISVALRILKTISDGSFPTQHIFRTSFSQNAYHLFLSHPKNVSYSFFSNTLDLQRMLEANSFKMEIQASRKLTDVRMSVLLNEFLKYYKTNPPKSEADIFGAFNAATSFLNPLLSHFLNIRLNASIIHELLKVVQSTLNTSSIYLVVRLLTYLGRIAERCLTLSYKLEDLQLIIAEVVKRLLEDHPKLEIKALMSVAVAYQFAKEHKNYLVNKNLISKFSTYKNIDELLDCFEFWNAYMIHNSEGDIMQEAASLKRLQLSIDSKMLVTEFIKSKESLVSLINRLDVLYNNTRYGIPTSDKRAVFRLKSTKRYVERLIFDFGVDLFQNQVIDPETVTDKEMETFLKLAKSCASVGANYNLHCSSFIINFVVKLFEVNANWTTQRHMCTILSIFFDSNVPSHLQSHLAKTVQFYLDTVRKILIEPKALTFKPFLSVHNVNKVFKHTFSEVDYMPVFHDVLSNYLRINSAFNLVQYIFCLRFLLYFVEKQAVFISTILEKFQFDFRTLFSNSMDAFSRDKFIRCSYLFGLTWQAYHPKESGKVDYVVCTCRDEMNWSENMKIMQKEQNSMESNSQMQTELLFKRVGLEFEKERFLHVTKVDFYIKPKIVLEIVGEGHFFNNEIDNYSKIKKKIFLMLGYRCLYVSDGFLKNFENKNKLVESIKKIVAEQKLAETEKGEKNKTGKIQSAI